MYIICYMQVTFWMIQIKSLSDQLICIINFLDSITWILWSKKKTYFIWCGRKFLSKPTQLTSIGRYINVDLVQYYIKYNRYYAVHHRRLHTNSNNNKNYSHNIIIVCYSSYIVYRQLWCYHTGWAVSNRIVSPTQPNLMARRNHFIR